MELFHALVVSKLRYGLSTVCLVKAQHRRLDGFCARCLRKVLGIPPSFVSKISNKTVFERAGVSPLTEQILHQQLVLLGKAARSPANALIRSSIFMADSLIPRVGSCVRRVGRPRLDWTTEVMKAGALKFGSSEKFERALKAKGPDAATAWRSTLDELFKK